MLPLFSLTIFLGAALLFLVEPMAAKMALPKLGGSPAVWNTCMMFFQAALLAGYASAHWSLKWLGVRRQAVVQAVVVLLPLAVLPVALRGEPAGGGSPTAWLLKALTLGVGLPFVVVSMSGPALQRWFAATGHRAAKDPYFLYAASNAGSLLALLAYPVVVEPRLGLAAQGRAWMWGYWAFAVLAVGCAAVMFGGRVPVIAEDAPGEADAARPEAAADAREHRARPLAWVALAFIPSSLTLGTTQFLSTDIAAVPLLWVVPLAIYLLTFIVAFGARPRMGLLSRLLPVAALALALSFLLEARRPAAVLIPLHLATLFVAALLCHSRLAALRPSASRLTEFYLLIALGGVLGGVFNALVAPAVFNSVLEYPIVLVAALLARPRQASRFDALPKWVLLAADIAIPVLIGGVGLALDSSVQRWLQDRASDSSGMDWVRPAVWLGLPSVLCYLLATRPVGFALGLAAMLALAFFGSKDGSRLYRERTFFGVYTVSRSFTEAHVPVFTTLTHGTTVHGLQYVPERFREIPLGYYHPEGPIGRTITVLRERRGTDGTPLLSHMGLIGLGTGSLAAYGQRGQRITFHEIDPAVVAIARNREYFTYLSDCKAEWDVALGDARLTVRGVRDGEYGLLVVDAFSSDSIPLHLLTREAFAEYFAKLRPGGVLAVHISNLYLTLEPVVARVTESLGLAAIICKDPVDAPAREETGQFSSDWVLVARDRADFGPLATDPHWHPVKTEAGVGLWTDDFSNIWSVFLWK